MGDPTDFELIEQIQARERHAYLKLQERYHPRIMQIAFGLLKNKPQAAVVVRQVFSFIWQQSHRFDLNRDRSVALWLYELTGYYAYERRQRQRQQRAGLLWVGGILAFAGGLVGGFYWLYGQGSFSLEWITHSQPELAQLYQEWSRQPHIKQLALRDPELGSTQLQALWSPNNRQIMLLGNQVPIPPSGKTYQLWAISLQMSTAGPQRTLNQVVESAGTFNTPGDGHLQWLSGPLLSTDPQRFLVTLEPQRGSVKPTGKIILDTSVVQEPASP